MTDHLFVTLAAAADGQSPSSTYFFVQLIALGAVFYFLLIRPQQKRQKELTAMITAVKVGDKVIMNSGIHGLVASVKETTLMLKVADNVKIEFDKAAIATVLKPSTPEA